MTFRYVNKIRLGDVFQIRKKFEMTFRYETKFDLEMTFRYVNKIRLGDVFQIRKLLDLRKQNSTWRGILIRKQNDF